MRCVEEHVFFLFCMELLKDKSIVTSEGNIW